MNNGMLNDQQSVEAARKMLESLPTDFEEVLPEPVEVMVVNYELDIVGTKSDGTSIVRRKPVMRKAVIHTYVPMKILHGMISSQERLRRAKNIAQGKGDSSERQEEMITWMTEQVLGVWKLTEPDMTYVELFEGVGYEKIFSLFNRFFGNLLNRLNK